MYKLEYLPVAKHDLVEIIQYISQVLQNPSAADRLAVEIITAIDKLPAFPYAFPVYIPVKSLKYEYRKLLVKNFIVFYYIDESNKLITISRVLYAKRNYKQILK